MKKIVLLTLVILTTFTKAYSVLPYIRVTSPAYCSEIQGETTINVLGSGNTTLKVFCWKQGEGYGKMDTITTFTTDANGNGSFIFPADEYPHGPITIRISGNMVIPDVAVIPDNCYLQLYNKGGVSWNEGLPSAPSQANGMQLVFEDDFDGPISIGSNSRTYTYYDHKPPYGTQDFSSIPFTSASRTNSPFKQADGYLRIRADANLNSAGLISSMYSNGNGFSVKSPSYWECRFIAPNAPGSWPAFWLLSKADNISDNSEPVDELDIIEAYGGEGSGSPNGKQLYRTSIHAWNQSDSLKTYTTNFYHTQGSIDVYKKGIPSTWYETPHVYGCKIAEDITTYYCDNIEVARHNTLPMSKLKPFYFMINLATGGGWTVNLSRYDGVIDMYVDYVRVFSSAPTSVNSPIAYASNISIYPNPVKTETTISLTVPQIENISVNVYNTLGQLVSSQHTRQQGDVKIPVDMSNMNKGIYMVKLYIGNTQTSKTIVKN